MRFHILLTSILAGLLLLAALSARSFAATPAQIDTAIGKAIDCIYAAQKNDNWEEVPAPLQPGGHDAVDGGQWGGQTGIAAYALLSAGQNAREPRLAKAIDFLTKAQLRGTYAVAMRAQVWPLVGGTRDVKEFAKRDCQLLLNGVKTDGPARGMWLYYLDDPKDERGDHSASQFAVLGVWACAEAGIEVPDQFWKVEDAAWRQHQMNDGGWAYAYQDAGDWGKPFFTMTTAGLATLYITQDKINDPARASCTPAPKDVVISRGLERIAAQFPASFADPGPQAFVGGPGRRNLYLLYGLHRLGLASGHRYFGKNDWFEMGSDYLIKSQAPDGSWGTVWETSLGLLFLSRSRAPVAINKLEYSVPASKGEAWNQRPRDVANVTQWIGKQSERRLNWQIVNVDSDPAQWLDAPILFISGSEDPAFNDVQKKNLRAYVESGGMIFANSDCGSAKFATALKKLGKDLFPAYEFRDLPPEHPIYTRQQFKREKWRAKPHLVALSNGVRELMVLVPEIDPAKAWQGQQTKNRSEHFELAADVYQYAAAAGDTRFRGQGIVAVDPAVKTERTIRVARLSYQGNWDPEPAAWRHFGSMLHNEQKIDLAVEAMPLGQGKLSQDFKFAHLTGTGKFTLTDGCKNELRAFVDAGGTLVVDAAGGSSEFGESAFAILSTLFPDARPEELPAETPLLKAPYDLTTLKLRPFAVSSEVKSKRLMAITRNGRPAVLFSTLDITAGLVGNSVDGVNGYAPKSAGELMSNIVMASQK